MYYSKPAQISAYWLFVIDVQHTASKMMEASFDRNTINHWLNRADNLYLWQDHRQLYVAEAKELKKVVRTQGSATRQPQLVPSIGTCDDLSWLKEDLSIREEDDRARHANAARKFASARAQAPSDWSDLDLYNDMLQDPC